MITSDITDYRERQGKGIEYDTRRRTFRATAQYRPIENGIPLSDFLSLWGAPVEPVDRPSFHVNPEIVRSLLLAVDAHQGVRIVYRSKTHPKGTERVVFPHAFVDTGFRWHVRAWCASRKEFRDFNLHRIARAEQNGLPRPSRANDRNDALWNREVEIRLKANPALPRDERRLIEEEFGFDGGLLRIRTRAALVMYVLQAYQVEVDSGGRNPRRHRLVLSNAAELKKYLWD